MPAKLPPPAVQRAELEFLARLTPKRLAAEIQASRYQCSRCGACCRPYRVEAGTPQAAAASVVWGQGLLIPESEGRQERVYHTNQLIVDGPEVRRIAEVTGLGFLDVARPAPTEDYDRDGVARSLLWVLHYKEAEPGLGECIFYDAQASGCTVYPHRPAVCRAFPFMFELDGREVQTTCECPRGGREDVGDDKALAYAGGVLEWYRTYSNLRYAFEHLKATLDPGRAEEERREGWQRFRRHAEQGYALYAVLDSEGLHRVRARLKGGRVERFELM